MTPANNQTAFNKSERFSFNAQVVEAQKLYPAEAFWEVKTIKKVKVLKKGKEEVEKFIKQKTSQMLKCELVSFDKKIKTDVSGRSKKPAPGGTAMTKKRFYWKIWRLWKQ